MTDNKTERYMIIFNDVGLTIKGYYNELISPLQRKKILDRLYSLIHQELFEGVQPLEKQDILHNEPINRELPTEQIEDTESNPKRTYKHSKKWMRKHKQKEKAIEPINENIEPLTKDELEPISAPQAPNEPKDPIVSAYDNEKDDNQYSEFKKKGLI